MTEEEILKFWEENSIFEKSLEKEAPKGDFVFYDGPPFATGTPHYGHIVGSVMKDVVPRYWTMNGYRVERRWGWDCHGLPIENIVEKEMGSKSKKDIEALGVDEFNAKCCSKVLGYVEDWKKVITRLGRWADMDNAYKTMDLDYMESVWWVFKQLYDKGLIYEGYRSMHICPRCETTLSQQEVTEGYKNIKDLSAIAKFKLETGQKIGDFLTNEQEIYAHKTKQDIKDSIAIAQHKRIAPKNGRAVVYRVRNGDVMGKIAQRYHCRVSQIKNWNNLHSDRLRIGQKLYIYAKASYIAQNKTNI